jgi:Uma2 family endonuclease
MPPSILQDALEGRAFIKPWTVEEYHQAIDCGMLVETPEYELIDGFIVVKDRAKAGEDRMTIGDRHALVVQRLVRLAPLFDAQGCHLRIQQPFAVPPINEPEPDAAVVVGNEDDYASRRPDPTEVLCVIEVADSSRSRDLGPKLRVYASAGIQQYVVVDLVNNVVLVHTSPSGESYPQPAQLGRSDVLQVRCAAGAVEVPAERLLP